MSDFNLYRPDGASRPKKIVGRGRGSGMGGTAGKGHKGQQSRSGAQIYPGFEGGQMPLYRRLAIRGFNNKRFRVDFQIVNLFDIESSFEAGEIVDVVSLMAKGLAKKAQKPVKILGDGKISKALTFMVDKVSASARAKIEAAGGKIETP
ncbi:50S ribosomal protein L15 [Spirochaetota bacterium]